MGVRAEFEEAFVLWDCNKDVNEYEAFKAGALFMAEYLADQLESIPKANDRIRQLSKELQS